MKHTLMLVGFPVCMLAASLVVMAVRSSRAADESYPLVFSGGHDIGKEDHGRPCVLIAAALGVKTEDFRKAFSGVTPARGRGPTGEEARKNKDALMKVLEPLGVTNDRLDEVSNYYRFKPQDGELWKVKEAKGHAVVENGKVAKIVITEPGSGYSSEPTAVIDGLKGVSLKVTIALDKDLKKNGRVEIVEVK
jgi:hypothetical protein